MPPTKNALGAGCLALFGLPFAAAGLFVVWMMLFAPQPQPILLPVKLVGIGAGLLFAFIGFGLIVAAIRGKKKMDALDRLKASCPDQPWKWRPDWANSISSSRDAASSVSLWLAAILWNGVTWIGVVLVVPEMLRKQDFRGLWFSPFVAVGLWFVWAAVRESLRRVEFGTGVFDLASVPYRLGGPLKGTIHTRFHTLPEKGVHVRLTCVHRITTGSGNSRSTSEKILWQDEADVPTSQIAQGPEGSLVPISFRIPQDFPETSNENVNDAVLWLVQASADVPGVDYKDSFEVPVYGRVEAPAPVAESDAGTAVAFAPAAAPEPQRHTVLVQPTAEGLQFYFPADRNPGPAFGATVFACMFGGITFFLITHHVMFVFPLAFGFFALVIFLIALFMLLGTSRVNIGAEQVTIHSGLLGIGPTRVIPAADIASIDYAIGMQSGGAEGTPYYDLRLRTRADQTYTLGSGVKDKAELEWLLAQMRKAIGSGAA